MALPLSDVSSCTASRSASGSDAIERVITMTPASVRARCADRAVAADLRGCDEPAVFIEAGVRDAVARVLGLVVLFDDLR